MKRGYGKSRYGSGFFVVGILLGFIAGVVVWNLLLAGKLDELYTRNRFLETTVEDYRTRLEKLEKSQPEKELTLKDVAVEIDLEDELEKMILQQAVKQKYEVLLGKKIDEIDMELVIQVVDKRIFRTNKYQYQLVVDKVALSSSLMLWLSTKEIKPFELE